MGQTGHDFFIQDTHSSGSDGPESKFLETGNTEFTDHEDIERETKLPRQSIRDRHTTARQTEHDGGIVTGEFVQRVRQKARPLPRAPGHAVTSFGFHRRGRRRVNAHGHET